jgi:hypothetical protein
MRNVEDSSKAMNVRGLSGVLIPPLPVVLPALADLSPVIPGEKRADIEDQAAVCCDLCAIDRYFGYFAGPTVAQEEECQSQ